VVKKLIISEKVEINLLTNKTVTGREMQNSRQMRNKEDKNEQHRKKPPN